MQSRTLAWSMTAKTGSSVFMALIQVEFSPWKCDGGANRNRTGLRGFAVLYITTLTSRHHTRTRTSITACGAGFDRASQAIGQGERHTAIFSKRESLRPNALVQRICQLSGQ